MALVELAAQVRTEKGKGAAHRCRQQGFMPGILYSSGEENTMIAVERHGFDRMLRKAAGSAIVIDLKVSGADGSVKALIKEVQRDPVTSHPLHLDLLRVSMDEPVHLVIPISLVGVAAGVKNEGGFLDHVLREVEIACLPADVPDFIELDVTALAVGDTLQAGDIQCKGFELITPPDRVIVAVHGKAVSEDAELLAGAEQPEGEEEPAAGEETDKAEGDETEKAKKTKKTKKTKKLKKT